MTPRFFNAANTARFNFDNEAYKDEPQLGFQIPLCTYQVYNKTIPFQTFQFISDEPNALNIEVKLFDAETNLQFGATGSPVEVFDATGSLGYKFYEFALNYDGTAFDPIRWMYVTVSEGTNEWRSDLIKLEETQGESYKEIAYRNSINTPEIYWGSGIVCGLYVQAQFYKRLPQADVEIYRESNDLPFILAQTLKRRFGLEIYNIPAYQQEQIVLGCSLDTTAVDSQQYVFEEGFESIYRDRFQLSNLNGVATKVSGQLSLNPPPTSDPNAILHETGDANPIEADFNETNILYD